ncbi:hypothetical protein MKY59_21350 [Paenibacillus sp. FSL W8-0426]|uniref:hypothetical protein n=1 Tax=Paenibacillus sp. FSL W8-0426 TaxID=2921714 RepID=UPI0030DD5F1F
MAKYHASPRYMVGSITFDLHGNYETDNAEEIAQLEALVPTWIKRLDEIKTEEPAEVTEPIAKAPAKPRRTSAK